MRTKSFSLKAKPLHKPLLWAMIALITIATATAAQAQPVPWAVNGHYYMHVKKAVCLDWYEARSAAAATSYLGLPGHLATVTSQAENDFIVSTWPGIGDPDRVWIGGTDEGSDGNWRWITGESWSYENWASDEPNGGTIENCLEYKENEQWNDGPCDVCDDDHRSFIVEYEPPINIPTMTQWGMILMGLLMAASVLWMLKKKGRRAAA